MLITAVAGALVIAAIVGYAATRPGPAAVAAGPGLQGTPSAAPSASTPPAETAPPPVAIVKVRVNSDPDGASVKEDGVELCGSTPCDILYKGQDADPAREHRLTVSHPGYRSETRTVRVGDSPFGIKLTRAPEAPRFVPAAPPRSDAPPAPTGYKNDLPY
jgi:serine/threonine-protein kinase